MDGDSAWDRWTSLKAADVASWVRAISADWPTLPIFRLRDPREAVDDAGLFESLRYLRSGVHVVRARESGVLEVDAREDAGLNLDESHGGFVATVKGLALSEDDRSLLPPSSLYDGVEELGTRLVDLGVDVIGPGGRVLVESPKHADIVVRRRTATIRSEWRSEVSTAREWRYQVRTMMPASESSENPRTIRGRFGYFELSKYERQLYLRPAFVFVVEQPQTDAFPGRRMSFVIPATGSPELEGGEGLGIWS